MVGRQFFLALAPLLHPPLEPILLRLDVGLHQPIALLYLLIGALNHAPHYYF